MVGYVPTTRMLVKMLAANLWWGATRPLRLLWENATQAWGLIRWTLAMTGRW